MPIQISCVVLSYNGGDALIRTLESCKLQTYPHKDLVIADDASTDNGYTVSVIEKWLSDNSKYFTKVLFIKNESNMGIVKNLRNASLQAQGEILFGLGQGDLAYSPDTFELIAKEIKIQRQTDPVDPYFWLGEYIGYKIEPNGKIRIVQLYKDLPHQHKLILENPHKALKHNLTQWEIGGIGIVYHKKFYNDDVYPLFKAPQNWEDGPTFIWALATNKKVGVLNTMLRYYEIGTGISWQDKKPNVIYYFKKLVKTILPSICINDKPLASSNASYISWLSTLAIEDKKNQRLIEHFIFLLSSHTNSSLYLRIYIACLKTHRVLCSNLYRTVNILIYLIFYKYWHRDKQTETFNLADLCKRA